MDTPSAQAKICPQCHQPTAPEYYFCPNCGKNLKEPALSTSVWAAFWLYFYTLILMPLTSYLIYRHWQGIKYFRSSDPKARRMGLIAIILLICTLLFVAWSLWAGTLWLQKYVQQQENGLGGGLGGGL